MVTDRDDGQSGSRDLLLPSPRKNTIVWEGHHGRSSQLMLEKTTSAIKGGIFGTVDDSLIQFGDGSSQIIEGAPRLQQRSPEIWSVEEFCLNPNPRFTVSGDMKKQKSMSCPPIKGIFDRICKDLDTPHGLRKFHRCPLAHVRVFPFC